jgi:hypothetical protein
MLAARRAGYREIDLPATVLGTDEPQAPIEDGRVGAVSAALAFCPPASGDEAKSRLILRHRRRCRPTPIDAYARLHTRPAQ